MKRASKHAVPPTKTPAGDSNAPQRLETPAKSKQKSRYGPHPGVVHIMSNPIEKFGGARFCRDCGLAEAVIKRQDREAKKAAAHDKKDKGARKAAKKKAAVDNSADAPERGETAVDVKL